MQTKIISGPIFLDEALFGIGLSYGTVSSMNCNASFRKSPEYKRLVTVSTQLAHKQGGHNKFLETIMLTLDITAARYWWSQFDTYRVGVTKQSESTMHTLAEKEFTEEMFEGGPFSPGIINNLNDIRQEYLAETTNDGRDHHLRWLKQVLPESFLQRRIVCLNLKTLQNIYYQRKNHRLIEWRKFFSDIDSELSKSPYEELTRFYIFGNTEKEGN
jgi:hypothetical protein